MKIVYVRRDEATGHHFCVIEGEETRKIVVGTRLRCAAYRFEVFDVAHYVEAMSPSIGVLLCSADAPLVGMVVHPAEEPLTREELAAALTHLAMVPRMLKAVDVEGVNKALVSQEAKAPGVRAALAVFREITNALDGMSTILPTNLRVEEAAQYQAEIVAGC